MYEFVRMDAIVSERLTSNSRIVDIYGHCGLSIFSEYLEDGVIEDLIVPGSGHIKPDKLNDTDDVKQRDGGVDLEAEDRLTEAHLVVTTLAQLSV